MDISYPSSATQTETLNGFSVRPEVGVAIGAQRQFPNARSAFPTAVRHRSSPLPRGRNVRNLRIVNDSLPPCSVPEGCTHGDLCPLNQVKAGTAVRIKQLVAAPEVSHRLREMGFCEEQQVKLVSRHVNVICQVCQARVGLSSELAESILVEPLPARKLKVA